MKTIHLFLISIVFALSACDRPECTNTNPVFDANSPNSKVYKDELINQLENVDQSKLTYWLQKYEERDGIESLYFNIQGDGLCAILHLNMNHWRKLEEVRKQKGVGRRGAEFTHLQSNVVSDSVSTQFIYVAYDRMID